MLLSLSHLEVLRFFLDVHEGLLQVDEARLIFVDDLFLQPVEERVFFLGLGDLSINFSKFIVTQLLLVVLDLSDVEVRMALLQMGQQVIVCGEIFHTDLTFKYFDRESGGLFQ